MKELHFDVQKPDDTIILTLSAPVIGDTKLELDLINFQDDILTMHILSNRKIADLVLSFLQRYARSIPFVDIDYPTLRLNTKIMADKMLPGFKIRHIAMINQKYIVEMEIN